MRQEITYQNSDTPLDNPIKPVVEEVASTSQAKKKTDPKVKLLIGLGLVITLLLPLSIISPKNKITVPVASPTPTPPVVQSDTPPQINPQTIPDIILPQFNTIESLIRQSDIILPPQLDDTTGRK